MAEKNGRPWYIDFLIGAGILAAVIVPLTGVNSRVGENAREIDALDARVERLRENLALLDEIDSRIVQVEHEVNRIERAREDIVQAICAATASTDGDYQRCLRAVPGDGGSPG